MSLDVVKRQAEELAADNRTAEPEIEDIFWFPDENEVRLVEVMPSIPPSHDGRIHPFYFRADPSENLPAPSGIALIRPEECRRLELPKKWGTWDSAVSLNPAKAGNGTGNGK
jgi:hypothetical protein